MTHQEFLSSLQRRSPPLGGGDLERAGVAVLQTLGECASRLEAEALADELPEPWADALRQGPHAQDLELGELCARVAYREGVRVTLAAEQVSLVLEAVANSVRSEVIDRLRLELPEPIGRLLVPATPSTFRPAPHLHPERQTLAEGRGGGGQPLSESRPARGQAGSVALDENPHQDRKLSTAHGLSQEQEGETLAAGRPGSRRPLSG